MADDQQTADTIEEQPYKPSSPSSKLDFDGFWEYDDAPQSADNADIKDQDLNLQILPANSPAAAVQDQLYLLSPPPQYP